MVEYSFISWIGFGAIVLLSSVLGVSISFQIKWKNFAQGNGFHIASGIIIGPYITGAVVIAALLIFPGFEHKYHLVFIFSLLLILTIVFLRMTKPRKNIQSKNIQKYKIERHVLFYYCLGIILLWVFALIVNSIFIPLFQNDSLEYATVARILYEERTLNAYPVLNPAENSSGFFGPWTHPPLYVSLIYLGYLIQGDSDMPGLMRLIAPWFLVASTIGVVALGSQYKKITGYIAGILFISTPLMFLGADSALLDALPVSGVVLLMLLVTGCAQKGLSYGAWVGLGLGIALWTHSQAILFVPMFILLLCVWRGFRYWKVTSIELATLVAVACFISVWPYLRNMAIFGSPISDNPEVFALNQLDWDGYFQYARGLDHLTAKIQYGFFKGWFAFEAFGLTFWIMVLGMLFVFRKISVNNIKILIYDGVQELSEKHKVVLASILLILIYLCGIIFSMLLGIDLMVRNERYMLIIIPVVVIVGAYGITNILLPGKKITINAKKPILQKKFCRFAFGIFVIFTISQLFVVGWVYRWSNLPESKSNYFFDPSKLSIPDGSRYERILDYRPSVRLMREIPNYVGKNELVLSMRPAEMFYSNRKMISYLDPRLVRFYKETSATKAVALLKKLGVQYIYLTDYYLPPVYNSILQEVLADPSIARLVLSYELGNQLYKLEDTDLEIHHEVNLTPDNYPWTRANLLQIGGRKSLAAFSFGEKLVLDNERSISDFAMFHRDYGTILSTGIDSDFKWNPQNKRYKKFQGDTEYLISLKLNGNGFVKIWVQQFDQEGIPIESSMYSKAEKMRIGELVLSNKSPEQIFLRRIKTNTNTKYLRISVEHIGKSEVKIEEASIDSIFPRQSTLSDAAEKVN